MHFVNRYTAKAVKPLLQIVSTLFLSVALVACGGNGNSSEARNPSNNEQPVASAQQSAANNAESSDSNAQTTVNVVARDFEFSLDANSAAAGQVTFVLTNEGSMPHDFAIVIDGERHKTQMLKPGESDSVTVDLAAGSYEYICTVPGHDILGMKGTFTVN